MIMLCGAILCALTTITLLTSAGRGYCSWHAMLCLLHSHLGSEDNTVRLWRASGECLQTIEHPGCVWDVTFLDNGDVVSACSDAVARVWTTAADRQVCGCLWLSPSAAYMWS